MTRTNILIVINLLIFNLGMFAVVYKNKHVRQPEPIVEIHTEPIIIKPEEPINYKLENPKPSYLDNNQTFEQLVKWNKEAPKITEIGTYGKTSRGKDLYYMRLTNFNKENKKVVLITAYIHGNEPLCSSTVMNYIGTILDQYGDDAQVTELVDTRDIYFIPVVSPDSYPNQRHVDGVDPNRNFPNAIEPNKDSVPPIKALQQFFLKIRPDAVISGHTSGRLLLTPWGEKTQLCPHSSDYDRVIGEMSKMSGYRMMRACQIYGTPIYGGEVDWYYKNGAFAIVMEFGTHQQIPSRSDIDKEFEMTFKSVLFFIKKAPEVQVRAKSYWRIAA